MDVVKDADGKMYTIDKTTGKRIEVFINESGEEFILDEKGQP